MNNQQFRPIDRNNLPTGKNAAAATVFIGRILMKMSVQKVFFAQPRPLGHSFKKHKHNSKYDALTKLNNLRSFQTHTNIYAYTLSILFGYTIFSKTELQPETVS
jgi:hypothetical protein